VPFRTADELGRGVADLGKGAAMLRPVWIGCLLAFVLNVPMKKIETLLKRRFPGKRSR
jgi:hypothetical protein